MHDSITIGANTFYVRKFEPLIGLKIWGNIGVKFGPALAQFTSENGLRGAVETLFISMNGEETQRMFSMVVKPDYVSITQTPPDEAVKLTDAEINRHMQFADLFELWWFALVVQFGPLLLRGIRRIGNLIELPPGLQDGLERSVTLSPQNS